jgi:hypothetical protein
MITKWYVMARSLLEAHPGWEVIAEALDGRDAV